MYSNQSYPQTISFLPEDTINPAIQNLGQTLGGINQAKIAQQEGLQKQFQSLLDISYENMMANHQKEVMTDWDKFKNNAIQVFGNASDSGRPINMNDWAKVKKEHDEIVRKAEYAKQLKQDYVKTMSEAAKLDAANKLDPETKTQLDNWKNQGGNIYDLPVPSSLIKTQYSPKEVDAIEKGMYNDTTLLKKMSVKSGKDYLDRSFFDPENVARVATDAVNTDPDFAKYVKRNYGTLQNYITTKQAIYNKQYEHLRPPSSFGSSAQTVPLNPYVKNGSEYVDVSSEGKTWSGTVTFNGKQYPVNNADVLEASKTGKIVVNAKVPNPDYTEYSSDPSKTKKEIIVPLPADDHGNTLNRLKKAKRLPVGWSVATQSTTTQVNPKGKFTDGSGNEYTLQDIQSSWKKKYGKDITTAELKQVLSNLKAK